MPGHPSLAIRRAILELINDENLLEKLDSCPDEVTNHPQRRLKVLAMQQLTELRLELKQELVIYGRTGKIGKLMGLLDRETLEELGKDFSKESSTNRSSGSEETSSTSTTPRGSELPQPMCHLLTRERQQLKIPSFIPALDVGSPPVSAQEKRQEIGTVKEFRNIIEVVKIPDLPKKLKDRTLDVTRKLSEERDSDETTLESDSSKDQEEIRGLLEGLRREMKRSIHPETSNNQNLRLIPSKPIERLKRDEAVQCPSNRKEKKDAITSPIESDPLGSALSDYTKAFDEDFSSSQPSSDPSIGQIRLEPEELCTRKIISIRPDGSFVRRKPRVYESEEDSPQSTSTSTHENLSESHEEEVISCLNHSNWRAGSRVLRLDFADLSSSAIETVSARGNESARHSLSIDLHSISQSENLSETQPSSSRHS